MATSRMADRVGRVLGGRYRLLAPIGSGGSGTVFLGEDVTLRRRVAVKLLHEALAGDDPFLKRFQAEAQAAAALSHPNIMAVHDWGEDDDGPYLVLQLLGAGSLRNLLDRGYRLSPSQALLLGLETSRALDYAHRRGLVHRDIKPANLLFDEEGRPHIADFGVARALAEAAWTEPAGAVMGSARYASPEQARGESADGRSDVYSLALVLVEAVTGQVPFAADTTVATLVARTNAPLVAPPELGPLGPVVERAGTLALHERLDAAGFAAALDRAAAELPRPGPLPVGEVVGPDPLSVVVDPDPTSTVRRPVAVSAAPDTSPVAPPADPIVSPAGARRRRAPWLVALAVLLLAATAAGIDALARASVPSHPVPTLVGKTVADARRTGADEKLKVAPAGADFDENAAAGVVVRQTPAAGAKLKEGHAVKVVVSRGPQPRTVPDLVAATEQRAQELLAGSGLVAKIEHRHDEQAPPGQVLDWQPRGRQPRGTEITVVTSDGPAPRPVPGDLKGKSFDDAAAVLRQLRLEPVRADEFTDDAATGQVFATDPGPGASVPAGGRVTVKVSKGPLTVAVPSVRGMGIAAATSALEQAGVRPTGVSGDPRNRVSGTNPPAGTKVRRGTAVVLVTG